MLFSKNTLLTALAVTSFAAAIPYTYGPNEPPAPAPYSPAPSPYGQEPPKPAPYGDNTPSPSPYGSTETTSAAPYAPEPTTTSTSTTTTSTSTTTTSTTSTSTSSSSTPTPPAPSGSCNTGNLQCCDSMQDSKSDTVASIFSVLGQGPLLAGLTGQVGFACSPLLGGTSGDVSCSQQAACCDNTHFSGAIAVGCMPLNFS